MIFRVRRRAFAAIFLAGFFVTGALPAETVAVRHAEGLVHGFLVLRALDGTSLASGGLIQTSLGDRVTSRLVFHFKDGSIQDETAVFTQSGRFRLLTDHMIQRGPTFPHPMEVSIDAVGGRVTIQYREDDGKTSCFPRCRRHGRRLACPQHGLGREVVLKNAGSSLVRPSRSHPARIGGPT